MSDGSDIKIVHNSLQEGASHMRAAAQAIEARLAAFDNETRPLRADGGEWEGAAAQSYNVAKDKWTRQMDELKAIIHSTGGSVDSAQVEFAGADRKGAMGFDSI